MEVRSISGGVILGLAAVLFLVASGRILGISGIAFGLTTPRKGDVGWRLVFVLGLLAGGFVAASTLGDDRVAFTITTPLWALAVAGFLVGAGTSLGSGCTSGHGICGMARLSPRSLVATITFIAFGMITTYVLRHALGGAS